MKREQLNLAQEPIRGSVVVLIIRLLTILLFFEGIYLIVDYLFTLGIPLPFDLHHHVSFAMFVVELTKIMLQLYLIVNVSLAWANNTYHLAGKHIVKRTGVLHIQEDVFPFENIRSIAVHQSFLGKLCNYGDLVIKISASGGYQRDIVLTGIARPRSQEEILNTYF